MNDDVLTFAQVMFVIVSTVGALSGIGIAIHAYFRRSNRSNIGAVPVSAPIASGEERLLRIEQAVDAIAVEVERISEGQRFLTKLQSERADRALPSRHPTPV